MEIADIFKHNDRWVDQKLGEDPRYFLNLAKGQKPDYLFIGCSDSRVITESLMGTRPGDVFIHRNIANVVPVSDLNALSVISYAVNYLKVKHIIVCGHYNCGGVKAAMTAKDKGLLNPWFRHVRDVYRLHKKELDSISSQKKRYDKLVELNVLEQCINVIKTRDVQKSLAENKISIHGWVYNIRNGKLIDPKIDIDQIMREIMDIYNLFK